jgi:hypothetical protein
MSAESLAISHSGSAASSIRCCVASFTREVLPEIWATIVFVIRALSRSCGREFLPVSLRRRLNRGRSLDCFDLAVRRTCNAAGA